MLGMEYFDNLNTDLHCFAHIKEYRESFKTLPSFSDIVTTS